MKTNFLLEKKNKFSDHTASRFSPSLTVSPKGEKAGRSIHSASNLVTEQSIEALLFMG